MSDSGRGPHADGKGLAMPGLGRGCIWWVVKGVEVG